MPTEGNSSSHNTGGSNLPGCANINFVHKTGFASHCDWMMPRHLVLASPDKLSAHKAATLELSLSMCMCSVYHYLISERSPGQIWFLRQKHNVVDAAITA